MLTRRAFLASTTLALLHPASLLPQAPTTHPKVDEIDHTRILAAATRALSDAPAANADPQTPEFLAFTLALPALAAACHVDPANARRYTSVASAHLRGWFLTPATRLAPTPTDPNFEPILNLAPLAELCMALPFLTLDSDLLAQIKLWFHEYLTFLTEARIALLARDARDHHGSSWLLQVAAFSRLLANDEAASEARHRFKTATLRGQINAEGFFTHEITSSNPYRDSLFNLDLLSGACLLLSTRFESLWDFELGDGPGLRAAIARHAPYIANRAAWPYRADQAHFNQLPGRRPALLFAARAYAQPDYATLWSTLDPDLTQPTLLRTFPIRQPVLWVTQPRHIP